METGYNDILNALMAGKHQETFFVSSDGKKMRVTIDEVPENTYENLDKPTVGKQDTTIVTGLWDLGRGQLQDDGFKRPYEHYKQKFAELLKAPVNMLIYVSAEDEEFIWQHRVKENTVVKIMELSEFKTWFDFFDKVQSIRTSETWYLQTGWLAESPQAKLEFYNPLVMSKMFLLNNATLFNPFQSQYFYWIDAGITNTVHPGYFYHDKVFDNLSTYSKAIERFLYLSYPYNGGYEIHGFPRSDIAKHCQTDYVKYVCRGGFFGGEKSTINEMNGLYYSVLSATLNQGLMGTEESIFTILAHLYSEHVSRFELQEDGLVWPFFEKLKDVTTLIKEQPARLKTAETAKTSLYVLGFNSPEQLTSICRSIREADPYMFEKTQKFLINNSTDESMFAEYDRICELYGFEEIHRENLGVCGGRQFVAEHFDKTDADFYMFFEDDMHLNSSQINNSFCRNGFRNHVPNLYKTAVKIMLKEQLDFLKFSFSEFYGDNSTQWSWYNVPQPIRDQYWPNYNKLPEHGLDPNAPKTQFNNILFANEIPYITGEVYYSNWPQIVSRPGNKKMFLDTTWAHPFEQTWMSHIFQLTKKDQIKSAVLLASPVTHERFEYYDGSLRKES